MAILLRCSLLAALPLMAMAAAACPDDGTCDGAASTSDEKGHALLQIHQGQVVRTRGGGPAATLLPPELFKLGVELLGSEQNLDELVSNSRPENIVYGGVPLVLRMVAGDGSDGTLRGEGLELYGLDSLDEVRQRPPVQNLINMLDVGGNYGAVTIAAFKKFPTMLRAVVVEPIPSTYFFIRWNMHLNGVPALDQEQLKSPTNTTGVLALNKAVVSNNRDSIDTCYTPPFTMNAFICNCQDPSTWPDQQKTKCQKIGGATMNGLVDLFGGAPITIAKVDCEGCEMVGFEQLHSLIKAEPGRLRRLVGELHHPSREIENVACMFEGGKYFVRLCATEEDLHKPLALECGENPTPCLKDPAATVLLNNILRDSSGDQGA